VNVAPVLAAVTSLFFMCEEDVVPPNPDLTRSTGQIALADWPFCDFFIIHTSDGFALVTWQRGMWFFEEGDVVYGALDQSGVRSLHVAGHVMSGEVTVGLEEVGTDLRRAQKAFYKRCKIE
jgi:hypothetical protein